MHEEERTGWRWTRVARYASPRDEEKYGPTLLDAAISYMEAKYGPVDDNVPVAFDRLKLPVVRAGAERRMPLAECTVVDVVAATRKLRKPKRNGRSQVRDAFVQSLGTVASLSGVQVHERAGFVTSVNVPVAAFERFLAALRATTWETRSTHAQKTRAVAKKHATRARTRR